MSSTKKYRSVAAGGFPVEYYKILKKENKYLLSNAFLLLECCLERLYQGALRTDQAAGLPVVKPVFVPHAAAILECLAGVAGRVEEVPDSECNV
jgi:hypothetical protein